MDCSTSRELMLEFVEGTLPPKVAAGVAEHIKSCPKCRQELEAQSSRTRVLQSLGRVEAPDQWDEISRSIGTARPANLLSRKSFWVGVVIGIIVLVAYVVFMSLKGSP